MTKHQISYKTFIPTSLHKQACKLLDYLTHFPFEKPTCCRFCQSTNFSFYGIEKKRKSFDRYICHACNRRFYQTSNTIFSYCFYPEIWGQLGHLYLAGVTTVQIVKQLNISKHTFFNYTKKIDQLMKDEYPELFTWWHKHQNYQDSAYSDQVEKQSQFFLNWIDNLLNKTDYYCPNCHQLMVKDNKRLAPIFDCKSCQIRFHPIKETHLKDITHPEHWEEYASLLIQGKINKDLIKQFGFSMSTARNWRKTFMKQLNELKLYDLVAWLNWQNKCRVILTLNVKQKNNLK